ncbi:MAG: hypothetical protein SV186_01390 [Candidatus Nanohaloarchaea archaeon]|nr:hypothetical protein [Candidatus Nanohaloarchaea archaeon]
MSNFAYVVMAGAALFVVGGIIAGTSDMPGINVEGDDSTPDGALLKTDLGVIGNINSSSRTISFGTKDIEYQSPNKTVQGYDRLVVSKGMFSSANSTLVQFTARQPDALFLTFTVAGARPIGDLVVKLNGETVRTLKPDAGERRTIKLTNISKGTNTVLLTAKGPGYQFWTSTRYEMRDVTFTLKDDAVRKNLDTFRLYNYEVEGFDTGTVRFFVNEDVRATAPLKVDINGETIWTGTPIKRNLPYTVSFASATTGLHPGENTISFYSQPGAQYTLSNVQMDVQYLATTNTQTVQKTFNIPLVKYQLFGKQDGKIAFDIERIGVRAPITIKLPHKTFTVTPDTGGTKTLTFSKSAVNQGQNTVTITTSGNYEIGNFTISVGG